MTEAPHGGRLAILGAGTFAEEIADLATEEGRHEVVAFVEGKRRDLRGRRLGGVPIVWIDEVPSLAGNCLGLCAVGSPLRSAFIADAAARGLEFGRLVHPSAQVSRSATLGPGTIVGPHAVIAAHVRLGEHVIVNRGALIGHHSRVGDFATLSPGANVAGRTEIGTAAYIGMGALVLDGLSVGEGALVGAGAVVTRNVDASVQVLGVPARTVKRLERSTR